MHLQVFEKGKVIFDNEIDQESVVLGRGSDCDVRCINEAISRRHLEIKFEDGEVFIKNLSKNNWTMFNDSNIPNDEYTQYFAFYELILPGELEVKINIEEEAKAELKEELGADNPINRGINTSEQLRPQKAFRPKMQTVTSKKKVPYKPQSNFSEILKMGAFTMIVAGFFLFQYKDVIFKESSVPQVSFETKRSLKLKKELWEAKRKLKQKVPPEVVEAKQKFETVTKTTDPLRMKPCSNRKELDICQLLADDFSKVEGVAIDGDRLYGFLGVSKRKSSKFSEFVYPGLKGIPDKYYHRLLVAYYFMRPSLYFKLRDMGFNDLYVYILDDVPMVPSAKAIFKVNFKKKRLGYNQVNYKAAIDGIMQKANPDYFNNYLTKKIIKVK
jgi:hypothetical protein